MAHPVRDLVAAVGHEPDAEESHARGLADQVPEGDEDAAPEEQAGERSRTIRPPARSRRRRRPKIVGMIDENSAGDDRQDADRSGRCRSRRPRAG